MNKELITEYYYDYSTQTHIEIKVDVPNITDNYEVTENIYATNKFIVHSRYNKKTIVFNAEDLQKIIAKFGDVIIKNSTRNINVQQNKVMELLRINKKNRSLIENIMNGSYK